MGSTQPVISVGLPLYNGEKYLEESICSLIDQSFKDWELIIYDAASTDRTPQVLADLWQKYPILQTRGHVIRSAVKDNVPKSLNAIFAQAKGKYFTWTSDDNRYLPEALAKMAAVLDREASTALVYGHSYKIDAEGKRTGELRSLPRENLVYGNNVGLCFLYRREVHEAIQGYDENRFLVEDYDFWMRASQKFQFHHLAETLYEVRYHGASLTENNWNKMSFLSEDVFERDFPGMQTWLPPVWTVRGHLRLVRTGLSQGKWSRAVNHAWLALRTSPLLAAQESMLKLRRGLAKAVTGRSH